MIGQAITPDAPSVTGTVSAYAISPQLPAGLALSTSTGVISGTPTAVSATAAYTVTASNSSGSTTTHLQIAVNPWPPESLSYPRTTIMATVGQDITPDIPIVMGTDVVHFAVDPHLPAGLVLNPANGIISGTPTEIAGSTNYVVTASNQSGSATVSLSITVNRARTVLLELGHSEQVISQLRFKGSRVLSQDRSGHWVLWDYDSGALVARGDQAIRPFGPGEGVPGELADSTFVIPVMNGLEVRSASQGSVLSVIALPGLSYSESSKIWWRLASDGSYICTGSPAGLVVWATNGNALISKAGDYSGAKIFAAPEEVRVALGPAGADVVERISVPDGTSSTTSSFAGDFYFWFLDGERFASGLGNSSWIYSKNAVQQALVSPADLRTFAGQGDWLWTSSDYHLKIYRVGEVAPVFTDGGWCDHVDASGSKIVYEGSEHNARVVDLSGPFPVWSDAALPIGGLSTFGVSPSGNWVGGNVHGAIVDGTSLSTETRYLGLGAAWSVAGGSDYVAVSTAIGQIFYFDPDSTEPEGTINFSSSKLAATSEGTTLAAMANTKDHEFTDRTLNFYSLPSGALVRTFPYTLADTPPMTFLYDFSLSASGSALGRVLNVDGQIVRQVTDVSGTTVSWSDTNQASTAIMLSPDGTLIAASNTSNLTAAATNIYKNGLLVSAVPGTPIGWIDDSRLLVKSYKLMGHDDVYDKSTVYASTGEIVAQPTLPEMFTFQTVTGDSIYDPTSNAIYSLSSSDPVWQGEPSDGVGQVSGAYVIYSAGARVLRDAR